MLRLLRNKLVKLADRILPANCALNDSIDALLPSYRNFERPPLKVRAPAVLPRFCRYHTSLKWLVLRFSALLPQFGKACFQTTEQDKSPPFRGDPWCGLGGFETIPDLQVPIRLSSGAPIEDGLALVEVRCQSRDGRSWRCVHAASQSFW